MRFFPPDCLTAGICLLAGAHRNATAQAATAETITIDGRSAAKPFPHFWEQMFGSSRAVLSMRESYREDLIDCYGISEVASWDFEVWNEPTIDFWTGRPAHEMYFQLYDNTARSKW